jgi:hypothetical protein
MSQEDRRAELLSELTNLRERLDKLGSECPDRADHS